MTLHAAIAGLLCGVVVWAQGAEPVLRSTTRLVEVSVIATGRHGEPVTGLTAADFRIRDSGKDRDIRVFSATEGKGGIAAPAPRSGNTFTNADRPGNTTGAVTVIVVDYLNTTWTDQAYCNQQLLGYLRKKVRPEDHLAIFTIDTTGLHVLHDFTTDASGLVASVAASKGKIIAPARQSSNYDPGLQLAALVAGGQEGQDARMRQSIRTQQSNQTLPTLHFFEQLAEILEGIPARKNVIWISGGIAAQNWGNAGWTALHKGQAPAIMQAPAWAGHDNGVRATDSLGDTQSYSRSIDKAMRRFNSANIALFPIEARGLTVRIPGETPVEETVASDANEQAMVTMAAATGGRAFVGANDLQGSIAKAVDTADSAYTLGFYADPQPATHGLHTLTVKLLNHPGVTLRYRKSYTDDVQVASDGQSRKRGLDNAALSPLDARAIPLTAKLADHAQVALKIGLGNLLVLPEHNRWTGQVDVLLVERDQHGNELQRVNDTLVMDFRYSTYQEMLKSGVPCWHQLADDRRAATVRVVVRDAGTGNLGSLTIPLKDAAQ